jgi:hypothetical protein
MIGVVVSPINILSTAIPLQPFSTSQTSQRYCHLQCCRWLARMQMLMSWWFLPGIGNDRFGSVRVEINMY